MPEPPVSRRTALLGLGGVAAIGAVDAFGIEPRWLDTTSHDVPVARLPRALDGFKVAQVTDAHLSGLGAVEESILSAIREHDVQLVVLTGDIIDSASNFWVLREFCAELAATGVCAVATLGNWEHWGAVPLDLLRNFYREAGVQMLVNEQSIIEGVAVCATDDATGGQVDFRGTRPDLKGDAKLLLTHSPAILDEMPDGMPAFDLALAGHTHGGQVRLGPAAVPFVPQGSGRFVAGWYETAAGPAYVSRGTGTSIAPVRFTCRPELPILRLTHG
jgi:predicted MPP superfamily phosphohydrolase